MSRRSIGSFARAAGRARVANRVERSCIGRIVSALTGAFIFACLALWAIAFIVLNQQGLWEQVSEQMGAALGVLFFGGILVSIIIAGVIGGALRRMLRRGLWSDD